MLDIDIYGLTIVLEIFKISNVSIYYKLTIIKIEGLAIVVVI